MLMTTRQACIYLKRSQGFRLRHVIGHGQGSRALPLHLRGPCTRTHCMSAATCLKLQSLPMPKHGSCSHYLLLDADIFIFSILHSEYMSFDPH